MKRPALPLMLLILASIFLLFLLNLLLGSVHIPFGKIWELLWGTGAASNPYTMSNQEVIWSNILWKSRVPQALTALVAGAGLSVSGLQMQTVFRNPLAGPSVLGISSGASLGVACVVLLSGAMGGQSVVSGLPRLCRRSGESYEEFFRLQDFGRSVACIAGSKQQACDKDRQVSCARYTLGLVHWSMFLVAGKRHPTPPGLCGEVYSIVTSFVMSDQFSTLASSILISCRLICSV